MSEQSGIGSAPDSPARPPVRRRGTASASPNASPPVVPHPAARTRSAVRARTAGWAGETLAGVGSSLALVLFGLVLFRLGLSSSPEFELDLLSPFALYESFEAIILQLSTFREELLLAVAAALLAATIAACALWMRTRDAAGTAASPTRRQLAAVVRWRAVSFLAAATLTVLGAYAYQLYLWRVALPIPADALGVAITREVAAASVAAEMADKLYRQGQARRVVIRELPVAFDARRPAAARSLGARIGAEAVVVYHAESGAGGDAAYVASVVFTDPTIDLRISGEPVAAAAEDRPDATRQRVDVLLREAVEVPALHAETLAALLSAAAGIIAYEEDRVREAIAQLELARAPDPDAPSAGVVDYHLGAAYELDRQPAAAVAAYERAAAFYDRRRQTGDRIAPADGLIAVRTLRARANLALLAGDGDGAVAWYERGVALREDIAAAATELERPADLHATFARLFGELADAHRFRGDAVQQTAWAARAATEADLLAAAALADDPLGYLQQSAVRFFLGDCVAAATTAATAIALDPAATEARAVANVVAYFQGRRDLSRAHLERIVAQRPADVGARQQLALLLRTMAATDHSFEPAYLAEAETHERRIVELDPSNLDAHRSLAEIASQRAGATEMDLTALFAGDRVSLSKSQATWLGDPARYAVAVEAAGDAIYERRIVADELRPDRAADRALLADAYVARQEATYFALNQSQAAVADAARQEKVALIAADAGEVRTATDKVLAVDAGADRADRLLAWAARTDGVGYELFASIGAADDARLEALLAEYRRATTDAVAVVEEAPIATADEADAARRIYTMAAVAHTADEPVAAAFYAKAAAVTAQATAERTGAIDFQLARCAEAREQAAGDALVAAGDDAAARPHFETALAANADHVAALDALGRLLYRQGDLGGAIARAETAAAIVPDDPSVWRDLGLYRLAAGDAAGRDAAYDRLLAVIASLPSREGMAALGAALADLRRLAETTPAARPAVVDVLPRFGAALDALGADVAETYQYPQLYADLGAVALYADAAAAAEPLLRRSLDIDPHQPAARANLVLAVAALGRDPGEAVAAALAEARDELWQRTTEYGPLDALTTMEEAADAYAERFPDRTAAASLTAAVTAERARLEQDG